MAQSYENFRTGLGDRLLREDAWRDVEKIAKNHTAGSVSYKDGRVKVDAFSASALVAVYNALKKSNQKKFIEVINSSADGLQQMLQFAFDSVNPAGKIKESILLHEINIDALWQKFLKKFKLREFDRKEQARKKELHKKNVKWNKMMGLAASVEHDDEDTTITEKIYAPMYFDAGMDNTANYLKFIKFLKGKGMTVTTPRKGVAEIFPKDWKDEQTIFKAAKRYHMISVKESVEHLDEGIRDFKVGDTVKVVDDDSEYIGDIGKITKLSGSGNRQNAMVKLKNGKTVKFMAKLDLIKESVEHLDEAGDPRIKKMSKKSQEILAHMANSLETTGGPWLDITNVKFLTKKGVDDTIKAAGKIKNLPSQAKKDLALIKKELHI